MSGTYCNVNLDSLFPGTSSLPQSVDVNAMNYVYKSNDLVQQVYEQKGNLTVKMSNKSNDTPLANNLSGSVMGRVGKAFSLLSMSILLFV